MKVYTSTDVAFEWVVAQNLKTKLTSMRINYREQHPGIIEVIGPWWQPHNIVFMVFSDSLQLYMGPPERRSHYAYKYVDPNYENDAISRLLSIYRDQNDGS